MSTTPHWSTLTQFDGVTPKSCSFANFSYPSNDQQISTAKDGKVQFCQLLQGTAKASTPTATWAWFTALGCSVILRPSTHSVAKTRSEVKCQFTLAWSWGPFFSGARGVLKGFMKGEEVETPQSSVWNCCKWHLNKRIRLGKHGNPATLG